MRLSPLLACAALTLLAACGGGDGDDDQRTASGQVLEGTISDSMIPLETLRSQPPLAKATGTTTGEPGAAPSPDAQATDATGDEAPDESAAADEPAADAAD